LRAASSSLVIGPPRIMSIIPDILASRCPVREADNSAGEFPAFAGLRSEVPLRQPTHAKHDVTRRGLRTVAAPIVRRRSPHPSHENRVTVPLDQKPLKHPMVSRSLRTGWPQ
jgi:hypothetical protein